MQRQPGVYILTNDYMGTLHVGVASNLMQRVWQHRNDLVEGYTRKYRLHRLVWFEIHEGMSEAIVRERQLKKWKRAWKIDLIGKTNPQWLDLWPELVRA